MKNKCFDIGIIQAFLDGEVASDLSERIVKHTAECDNCALAMNEAEEENAFAFSALDSEFNVLVPTERLRTKLFFAIEEIENKRSIGLWTRLTERFAFLGEIDLRSPSVAALACTLLFVGTFAFALKFYPSMKGVEVAVIDPRGPVDPAPDVEKVGGNQRDEEAASEEPPEETPIIRVDNRTKQKKRPRVNSSRFGGARIIKAGGIVKPPKPKKLGPAVEGEDIYLSTISTLNNNVDQNKDLAMRPKERIAFERNLAMVNNAITSMKAEVRKNPKNQAAKELLKSSYQNKIDLLNSVSEKNELMASIQ